MPGNALRLVEEDGPPVIEFSGVRVDKYMLILVETVFSAAHSPDLFKPEAVVGA
jgi:hypothetical protein